MYDLTNESTIEKILQIEPERWSVLCRWGSMYDRGNGVGDDARNLENYRNFTGEGIIVEFFAKSDHGKDIEFTKTYSGNFSLIYNGNRLFSDYKDLFKDDDYRAKAKGPCMLLWEKLFVYFRQEIDKQSDAIRLAKDAEMKEQLERVRIMEEEAKRRIDESF